jgi:hypothetical protein
MTTTNRHGYKVPTRLEMAEAQKTLKARGWEHRGTIMVDDASPERADFGLIYTNPAKQATFYLNVFTINALPA